MRGSIKTRDWFFRIVFLLVVLVMGVQLLVIGWPKNPFPSLDFIFGMMALIIIPPFLVYVIYRLTVRERWRPEEMINHLGKKATDRKLRLFLCAWMRTDVACSWYVAPNSTFRNAAYTNWSDSWIDAGDEALAACRAAVDVAERFADGLATDPERSETRQRGRAVYQVSRCGHFIYSRLLPH